MKRSGFTLVELIFVIVIIGVLSAVAVPKFKSLKQSAEVKNVIKIVKDAESAVPSAGANMSDLEDNTTFNLSDILNLTGKNIGITDNNNTYDINASKTVTIATIKFSRSGREVNTTIDCTKFTDTTSQAKCKKELGVTSTYSARTTY